MNDIVQIAGIGLLQSQDRLEVISRNAAGATLPGFRREVPAARSFAQSWSALEAGADVSHGTAPRVDLHVGGSLHTGRALDVQIDAADQFLALTDGSEVWLTRAGALHVDAAGVLVGEGGLRVVGTQGDIRVPDGEIRIGSDGSVAHQDRSVGSLQLYRAQQPAELRAARGSLLAPLGGIQPVEPQSVLLRTGALEASNTDATRELLELITLSRQFEGLGRVVQSYDAALGQTLQKLGEI